MGNEQSVSADDDLSSDNNLRKYDPYIEDDDYRVANFDDQEHVIKATRSNKYSMSPKQQPASILPLPLRRHHIGGIADIAPPSRVKALNNESAYTPSSRVKALMDNESVYTPTPSASSYDGTEEDNSLVSYDDDGTMEDTSGTTGTYNSNSDTLGGAQRSLYDTDDVTAMTDMAHDGDDEATAMSEDDHPQQKMSKKEEKRRARWKAMRRKMKENGSNTDDEETIVIIDADEEYSRSATMDEQDISLGNPTGPTIDSHHPSMDDRMPHHLSFPEVLDDGNGRPTDGEPSDKENATDEIVLRAVERAAREKSKVQFQSLNEGADILPRDSVTSSTHSKSEEAMAFDKESLVDSAAVVAARESTTAPSSRKSKSTGSTGSSRKQRAKARIIVPAVEVTPRKRSTQPMKVVAASDVETSPRYKLGGHPRAATAKTDVVHSIPVLRDTSDVVSRAESEVVSHTAPAPTKTKLVIPVVRDTSDVVAGTESEVVSRPTAPRAKKNLMTVVVASDVEVRPKHTTLGRAPEATAAPKQDVLHATSRADTMNTSRPDTAPLLKPADPVPNPRGTVALDSSAARAKSTKRDVPVVINGKIVGSSSSWMSQKPSPESPKRTVRKDEQSVRHPSPTKQSAVEVAPAMQQQFTYGQVFPVATAADVDTTVRSVTPSIVDSQLIGRPGVGANTSFQASLKEEEKTATSKEASTGKRSQASVVRISTVKHQLGKTTEQANKVIASEMLALGSEATIMPVLKSSGGTEMMTATTVASETKAAEAVASEAKTKETAATERKSATRSLEKIVVPADEAPLQGTTVSKNGAHDDTEISIQESIEPIWKSSVKGKDVAARSLEKVNVPAAEAPVQKTTVRKDGAQDDTEMSIQESIEQTWKSSVKGEDVAARSLEKVNVPADEAPVRKDGAQDDTEVSIQESIEQIWNSSVKGKDVTTRSLEKVNVPAAEAPVQKTTVRKDGAQDDTEMSIQESIEHIWNSSVEGKDVILDLIHPPTPPVNSAQTSVETDKATLPEEIQMATSSANEMPVRLQAESPLGVDADPDGQKAGSVTANLQLPPSPNKNRRKPKSEPTKIEMTRVIDLSSHSNAADNSIVRGIDVAPTIPETVQPVHIAKGPVSQSPSKSRGTSSATTKTEELLIGEDHPSLDTSKRRIAHAIDVLSLDIPQIEQVVALSLSQTETGKKRVSSPKPEDARGTLKRNVDTAPTVPKLTCIGSGDDDLRLLMSDDYDDGIDLSLVENYDKAFNSILEAYPDLAAKNSKLIETIRIAKLQRILSVTLEVESELESHVQSLAVQKAEMTSHYHNKLLDASRKRASREISLAKTLEDAQRDNRLRESQMTWQLVTMCHVNTKQSEALRLQVSQQPWMATDPLAILPKEMAMTLRDEILSAIRQEATTSLSPDEQVDFVRQLELNNALLSVQASVLERKLLHLQSTTQPDWVEAVFSRMSTTERMELKKRYEESLGFTLS